MNFVNNWARDITLASGATSAALDLPDGSYRLVLTDAAGEAIEVVGAAVASGAATLTRGQEGTADAEWPTGSKVQCSLTAGTLLDLFATISDLQARVTALEPQSGPLLLEVLFTEASWWLGDYPVIRSVQGMAGGAVADTLDISAFTQADSGVGSYVNYQASHNGSPGVLIGYEDRLTLINTGVVQGASWDALRIGLAGITYYDGACSALTAYIPRSESGTQSFVRGSGIVYVDIPLI